MFAKLCALMMIPMLFVACVEKEFDPNNPELSYSIAKEPYDDGNYEIAIQRLGEFKSRFPYSKYAVEAELLLANAHFELSHYTEAALAYEQFVKLHPKHPKVDFALFRVGESYWADAPEEIDREQEYTHKAVVEWDKLIQKMPDSEYAKKAKELSAQGKRRIAESIAFIFRFYCKQDLYPACAYRAIQLADEYPEFADLRVEALQYAIKALEKVAEAKGLDAESDKNLYFKTMTSGEIKARADGFKKLLADYEKTVKR